MFQVIENLLESSDFSVVEKFTIGPKSARFADVPLYLYESKIGSYLEQTFPQGLWTHQSESLVRLGKGLNVVTSTGTASGKSLIFRAHVLHEILKNPDARAIVFYPLRALVEDQLRGWREMAASLGLDPQIIGRIDGTVRPFELREEVLKTAKIIVMTPDVLQAWLMSRLASPSARSFVGSVSIVVMDEAHTLEGVFGSNFAFLIRRLLAARDVIVRGDRSFQVQLVAATATIANPAEHLKRLTGFEFDSVDHTSDGADYHERIVAHVACPEGGELEVAQALQQRVIIEGDVGSFITFVDSRKGVETLAMATDRNTSGLLHDPAVSSYRAGYTAEERRRIERDLRSGTIKGVVSTSALELGIDFPSLSVGFNLGVPATRKAYRQRLGRIGRNSPGAFVVIGNHNQFRQYGITFSEYHQMSVEPSYLYLDNRFMQFAHGRCLAEERDALGAPSNLSGRVSWPEKFSEHYQAARPDGNRPRDFDIMAQLGGDSPHLGYPLRNIGERAFQIKLSEDADPLGDVSLSQALRECYPGATYFHNMRPYYVSSWHAQAFEQPYIQVRSGRHGRSTRPRIGTWINASISSAEVLDQHLVRSESGFLAECHMSIQEKVDGFFDVQSGEFSSYRELQQANPYMKARSRYLRTTGVVLCIHEDWFNQSKVKPIISERLREIFAHEYSVSPQDLGSAATNIAVIDGDGTRHNTGCVVIFDQTYGSLRFTEKLYLEFDLIVDRLISAVDVDPDDSLVDLPQVVRRIKSVSAGFESTSPFKVNPQAIPTGYEQVFEPGSTVCYHEKGSLTEDVEVIRATMMDGQLRYQVKAYTPPGQPPVLRWLLADRIEPSVDADQWKLSWWNVQTEQFEAPDFVEDPTP